MCLQKLKPKQTILATCKTSTLNKKPCYVGYKILRKVRGPKDKTWKLSTTVLKDKALSQKVKSRWTKRKFGEKKNLLVATPFHDYASMDKFLSHPRRYPVGCHVYTDLSSSSTIATQMDNQQDYSFKYLIKRTVNISDDSEFAIILVPVLFYKEDVVASGEELDEVSNSYKDVLVLKRYYIRPETYKRILSSSLQEINFAGA